MGSSGDGNSIVYPSPADLEQYLPWACVYLQIDATVRFTKGQQSVYTPVVSQPKKGSVMRKSKHVASMDSDENVYKLKVYASEAEQFATIVYINTFYDALDNLTQMKILKNKYIECEILNILTLIIQFYPYLTSIYIDSGLDKTGVYYLSKIINLSNITDVILDNNVVLEANYYILLEKANNLNYLSLARCNINDAALEKIVSNLPLSNLSILNLSSNRITNVGAAVLGHYLRSDRKLVYLNLAGNMISDIGADSILSSLMEFQMTSTEIIETKTKRIAYLREHPELLSSKSSRKDIVDKKKLASKSTALTDKKKKRSELDLSSKAFRQMSMFKTFSFFDKEHEEPFKAANTFIKNSTLYCYGNNFLNYLSLAYNDLTFDSVKKLHAVFKSQEKYKRQPIGLVNVCIEGNHIPETCEEFQEIDKIIKNILTLTDSAKKRREK